MTDSQKLKVSLDALKECYEDLKRTRELAVHLRPIEASPIEMKLFN